MFKGKLRCVYRLKSSKSAINVLMICGLVTLFIQICIFLLILYASEGNYQWPWYGSDSYFYDPIDDLDIIKQVFSDVGLSLTIADGVFLSQQQNGRNEHKLLSLSECQICDHLRNRSLLLVVDRTISNEVFDALKSLKFHVVQFKNYQPNVISKDLETNVTTGYLLKRYATFFILILYRRDDNVWWFGHIHSDIDAKKKIYSAGISYSEISHIPAEKHEGILNKFETTERELAGTHLDFSFPKNVSQFLADIKSSKYVECNHETAQRFEKVYSRPDTASAQRFRHRAWKLLAKAKTVFDSLGIEFWLSSGTLLGYVRECGIISYSKDVDVGVMADAYTDSLHRTMSSHGFHLLIRLGKPEDSFELSYTDQAGVKLDIFFFYKNKNGSVWNGGTQVKSGRKFKYTFPPFDLCWTIFQSLKVRVPCDAEKYIEANYGSDWFTPVKEWDWKSSPFNVQPNGKWPEKEWPQVIKVFH